MSRPNIELVKVGLQAGAQRPKPDFETINEVYDPDHVFVPVSVETTEVKGGSGYKAWLQEEGDVMAWTMEYEGAIEIGPRKVLAQTTAQFHGGSSEIDIDQRMWMIVTVENGRITRTEAYLDPAEALEAAGLSK
jgi:ketosteroid isomerase-like protein